MAVEVEGSLRHVGPREDKMRREDDKQEEKQRIQSKMKLCDEVCAWRVWRVLLV